MKDLTLFDFEPIPNKELAIPKPESTCGKCIFQRRNQWNSSLIYCGFGGKEMKKVKSRQPSCPNFKPL